MSIKIYLIKHIDTGMGYVGITGDELGKRWYQHLHDPKGALYTALRAEGHRMSMEMLDEVETREEALIIEQQYIHELGTAQPNGWNRDVRPLKVEEPAPVAKPKEWKEVVLEGLQFSTYSHDDIGTIVCPRCFKSDGTCDGQYLHIDKVEHSFVDSEATVQIYFLCETCYVDYGTEERPLSYLELFTTHGQTTSKYFYFVEDK